MAVPASQQIDRNHKVVNSNEAFITSKTITFTGASGLGEASTNTTFFNTTGSIVVNVWGYCSVDLVGAATISLGLPGVSNQLFVSNTTATNIDAGLSWSTSTPAAGVAMNSMKHVSGTRTIGAVVTAANITAGTLTLYAQWRPISTDGTLTAA